MSNDTSLDGLLVIDKPAGWTSHDVVARVRRLTGTRRVGHAGTLDPAATGVLPLGIGAGTRVLEYLSDAGKSYRATVRLGVTTDTDDAEGSVLSTGDWSGVTPAAVQDALAGFLGEIEQVPPAYSAIKREGVPLYRMARRGADVRPEPRRVRVDSIHVLDIALPDITFDVACSKGTYVRSLARDLGAALSCGAHLAGLRRLAAASFTLADALTLDELAGACAAGDVAARLRPPDTALLEAPALVVSGDDETRLLTGRSVPAPGDVPSGRLARAYSADGFFLAIVRAEGGGWRPEKVFASPA